MSTIAPARIVEVIATDAHEGPVYAADEDALYFTTVPRRSSHLDLTLPLVSVRRLALDGLRFPLEQPSIFAAAGGGRRIEVRV